MERYAVVASLVRSLRLTKRTPSEAVVVKAVQAIVQAASKAGGSAASWTETLDKVAAPTTALETGLLSKDANVAQKAAATFTTAVASALGAAGAPPSGAPEAQASEVASALLRGGRTLARPGELAEPAASRFWSSSFFTTTKAVPFTQFIEKLSRLLKDTAEDGAALIAALAFERTVLQPLQRVLVGSSSDIGPLQLQDAIEDAASVAFPGVVLEVIRERALRVPPLDAALRDAIAPIELQDRDLVTHLLRDNALTLHESCKLPTARLIASLREFGVSEGDAAAVAHAVYQAARKALPLTVRSVAKLDQATYAIAQKDTWIDMANCGLVVDTARSYLEALQRAAAATRIDVSGNNLHADGAADLAQLIVNSPKLTALDVSGNVLQLSGCAKLLEAATKAPLLSCLDLSCSHGGPGLPLELIKWLPMTHITALHINGNSVGPHVAAELAKAVAASPRLVELSLASNALGDATVTELMRSGVANTVRLRRLDLRGNGITDAGALSIAAIARSHPALLHIDLSSNPITDAGAAALLEALEGNHSLAALHLDDSRCSKETLAKVSAASTAAAAAVSAAQAAAVSNAVTRWSIEEVATWLRTVHRRPDLADALRKLAVNGPRLVSYTARAMKRDGIADSDDREFLMGAIAAAVKVTAAAA